MLRVYVAVMLLSRRAMGTWHSRQIMQSTLYHCSAASEHSSLRVHSLLSLTKL